MEEPAPTGCGGLLQLARRGDRNPTVVVTGILAWQWELEGQKLKGILLMHLVLGCVSNRPHLGVLVHPYEDPAETTSSSCPDTACRSRLWP